MMQALALMKRSGSFYSEGNGKDYGLGVVLFPM